MLKSILAPVLISFLALFGFVQTEVTVNLNIPESANAGNEFLVEATINKGNVEGFARYEQELPVGFKAVGRSTANGDFRFENNKIKIQWMRLPADREVTISYAIQVDPTVSGDFTLDGKFSYIFDNGVKAAEITPAKITIIGDEAAAGTLAAANTSYSYQNVSLKNIDCIRQKPYLNENNEVIVNLLINKGDLKQFGKVQEQIPRGYKALSLRSKNSIFTYKNGIIKFLWMNMPPEEQFVVTYKLVPVGEIPDQQFIITGTFSYAENERTKTLNIAERNVDLENFDGDQLMASTAEEPVETPEVSGGGTGTAVAGGGAVLAAADTETETENTQAESAEESASSQEETKQTNDYLADNTENQTTEQQGPQEQQSVVDQQPSGNLAALTGIPLPEQGVSYRVQVAAGHKLVGNSYFKHLNVTDKVQVELHDGWHKYTVGNFKQYRDARDYRIYIWNNTPIHDAFVSAYNSGMRITVQEALMIANQKWYR